MPVLHKLPKFDLTVVRSGIMSERTDSPCDALLVADAHADGDQSSVVVVFVRTAGTRRKTNVNNTAPAEGSKLPSLAN